MKTVITLVAVLACMPAQAMHTIVGSLVSKPAIVAYVVAPTVAVIAHGKYSKPHPATTAYWQKSLPPKPH